MRNCDTCRSEFVKEIDQLILSGWTYKEILRHLKTKYPDKVIPSYDSLREHGKNHVHAMIERGVESNKEREKMIKKEIQSTIIAIKQLNRNLQMTSEGLEQVWSEWSRSKSPSALRQLGDLITNTNKSIELLLKFSDQVTKGVLTEEEIFDKIMFCIRDFPPEYIKMFRDRWEGRSEEQ